jgi:hypothetical protein
VIGPELIKPGLIKPGLIKPGLIKPGLIKHLLASRRTAFQLMNDLVFQRQQRHAMLPFHR